MPQNIHQEHPTKTTLQSLLFQRIDVLAFCYFIHYKTQSWHKLLVRCLFGEVYSSAKPSVKCHAVDFFSFFFFPPAIIYEPCSIYLRGFCFTSSTNTVGHVSSRRKMKTRTILSNTCVDHYILLLKHLSDNMHFITNCFICFS